MLKQVYQAVREQWAHSCGTTLTQIRDRISSSPQGHSNPDQLASLSTLMQMLKEAKFKSVAVPWKYYGLAVFGGTR